MLENSMTAADKNLRAIPHKRIRLGERNGEYTSGYTLYCPTERGKESW